MSNTTTKKKVTEKNDAAPARPTKSPRPAKESAKAKATAPQVKEPEPIHCASPPCMMGELDEILEE